MAVENLKSTAITNLDATPPFAATTGLGGPGRLQTVDATITPDSSASTTSTYRMLRLPSCAVLKHLLIDGAAETAGAYNVGLYYSDSPFDGTNYANQGAAIDATMFASAYSLASAVQEPTDIVNQNSRYPGTSRLMPLWQAINQVSGTELTADPGGFFDIVLVCTTSPTAGALIHLEAQYVI